MPTNQPAFTNTGKSAVIILVHNFDRHTGHDTQRFLTAVLDRLLHHAQTIVIEGSSYRMKDRENQ